LGLLAGACVLTMGAVVQARLGGADTRGTVSAATTKKVLRYIRERFGVTDAVKLTIDSWQPFADPSFYETALNIDNGREKRTQDVYLSRDHEYLVLGKLLALTSNDQAEVIRDIRQTFKIPEAVSVTASPYRKSPYAGLDATTITVEQAGKKQTQDFYVTTNHRCLVIGNIFNMALDPREEALRTISLRNQPSQGAARAPVTIVEFSDLECPMCARLHLFFERELLPRYPGKVRVIYKELPLTSIHDWSITAAIANECVFRIKPDDYAPFRSLIFQSQMTINAANVRDTMLAFGDQLGINHVQLAGCLDSKATLPQIEEDLKEAKRLSINSTPTSFVNGEIIVGMQSEEVFYKAVEAALRDAK
jgi:protein-disulfide isomerase